MPIASFKHKGLKELFLEGKSSKVAAKLQPNALLILDYMHSAKNPDDLIGVKDFHPLKANRKGTYSMHVNGNYCITFGFDGEHFTKLNLEDYH
jgi:proteic killer suppression protein